MLIATVLKTFPVRVPGAVFLGKAIFRLDQDVGISKFKNPDEQLAWALQQGHWLKLLVGYARTTEHMRPVERHVFVCWGFAGAD